jgi:hypothetical protein
MSNKQMAEELGVHKDIYAQKRRSNEGKALLKTLGEFRDDDKAIVEAMMHDEAVHSFGNLILARDRLYEINDYDAAAKIDLKILSAIGFWEKNKVDVNLDATTINITLGHGQSVEDFTSIPEPVTEAEYTILPSDTT